jgi:hypothetical protein
MEAAITVTARSDDIFTGTCSPKMGTIDVGDPEDGDPEDARIHKARDPEHQAICGELPTDFQE